MLPDWSGEAVTCLSFSPDGSLLAAGGAQGTVRVWKLEEGGGAGLTLVPQHSVEVDGAGARGAAGAVRWLPTPGGWVLLTGNRNNAALQLWHAPGGGDGRDWQLLQSLQFEGKDGQAEFFNHVDVVPAQQLVVLADTARKAVYTLHWAGVGWRARQGAGAGRSGVQWQAGPGGAAVAAPRLRPRSPPPLPASLCPCVSFASLHTGAGPDLAFDYVARFGVAVPILSFTALWSPEAGDAGEAPVVELNCVQTTAIQQYSLDPALCCEAGPDSADSGELAGVPARRSSLLERHGKDWQPIQASPSSAVPMPSEELATGTPRGGATPLPPESAVEAAEEAAAPQAEPSIVEEVPLSAIPPPPAPEPLVPKGGSGDITPEECPSPPPTPTEQRRLAAEAAALETAQAALAGAAAPPPAPRLLTPSDLLEAAAAGGAAPPSPALPAAAVEADEEPVLPPSPLAPASAVPPLPAAAAASDAAVAAAVAAQMGGVHKKFVGHVSLMYRELLKAVKAEMTQQAAAQQQATAQLLAAVLEAQKQQVRARWLAGQRAAACAACPLLTCRPDHPAAAD